MRTRTTRRAGYTLIELLVSMALIMTIMSILSMAFVTGLKTFGSLRATADMSQRLRLASSTLRSDLSNFHFDGAIRPSDPGFSTTVIPREGFVRIYQSQAPSPTPSDGTDAYGNNSPFANPSACGGSGQVLHLSVKRRGNRPEDFFVANLPGGPLGAAGTLGSSTTFFGQPGDARNQTSDNQYFCQWAEVMYYLSPIAGATTSPINGLQAQPLYGLYRAQRLLVANNTSLGAANAANGLAMSINATTGNYNTPADLTTAANRALNPTNTVAAGPTIDTLLVGNVMSFTVRPIIRLYQAGTPPQLGLPATFDVSWDSASPPADPVWQQYVTKNQGVSPSVQLVPLFGVEISIRLWDLKSSQARQITIIQDL